MDEPVPGAAISREQAQMIYKAGEDAYRLGQVDLAAKRFEQAYKVVKFPSVLYDIAQAYRLWYEKSHDMAHLKKSIDAYRAFIARAPRVAKEQPLAQRFLSLLDHEWLELRQAGAEPTVAATRPQSVSLKRAAEAFDEASLPGTPVAVRQAVKPPVYKKWWLWTAVVGGAVAVALGVGLGVGLGRRPGEVCVLSMDFTTCQ